MKKLVLAMTLAGILSTGAMAAASISTVKYVWIKADRTVIALDSGSICRVGSVDSHSVDFTKSMTATALTAKASDATVTLEYAGATCLSIILK